MLRLLAGLFLIASVPAAQAAGADCRRPQIAVEHVICADTSLVAVEWTMTDLFARRIAMTPSQDRPRLHAEQNAFLLRRSSECLRHPDGIAACARAMTQARADAIAQIVERPKP